MKINNKILLFYWLNFQAWWSPIKIAVACILLVIVLSFSVVSIYNNIPIYSYTLNSDLCKILYGCSPSECIDGNGNENYYYLKHYDKSYIDEENNLVIKVSKSEAKQHIENCKSVLKSSIVNKIDYSSDFSKISMELPNGNDDKRFIDFWIAEWACLNIQLFSGVKYTDIKVDCIIWHKKIDNVIFHSISPKTTIFFDSKYRPLVHYTISSDFATNVFNLSLSEFKYKYKDSLDAYTKQINGDLTFGISIIKWQKWYDYALNIIEQADFYEIEVSEDYTQVNVTTSTASSNDDTVDTVRRMCSLLQLLDGKDVRDIEVIVTKVDSETKEIIGTKVWDY